MKKNSGKKGVLLVNLGTPDSPSVPDVRKYLREFLMDKRVVDIPFLYRWLLVNLIIAPFRAPKSAKIYRKLWQERGSPLMFYGVDVRNLLAKALGDEYLVSLAMRYQSPSIAKGLDELKEANVSEIIIVPLFPQYASATSGSVIEKVMEIVTQWQNIPIIKTIDKFFDHPLMIKAFADSAKKYMTKIDDYDFYVFSYHGIPERQIKKASVDNYCQLSNKCCSVYHKKNQYCYRGQCFATSRLLAAELGIPEDKYVVSFQSRLGNDPWIKPYTDEILKKLPGKGYKRVLAFSPAFVADCLETTIEVGEEFKEEFEEAGGEHWQLVDSLNDNPVWIKCLEDLVKNT
jgi:protoporphyrin/coproporphyrin ferrochelatase